ncbi:hypothetical protein FPV67DRAFT_1541628 [Lyophyllum atratum]|nr:hypothetical protein FPV67DRAFT_1541628 [Lyophyllum atratum]
MSATLDEPVSVWFDDGTLVIKAENTEFKVYLGLLCSKSSIFRDMFVLNPHVPERVVELSDSPLELSYFLKALHDTDFFPQPKPALAAPFAIVAGILRLSDKYDVPTLRKRALEHLAVVYPTSLAAYALYPRFESSNVSDHLNAIKLSRDFNIPWIRPMAFYHYLSQPLSAVLTTLHSSDLSGEDVDLCIRGVRELKTLQFLAGAPTRIIIGKLCNACHKCSIAQTEILNRISSDDRASPLEVGTSYLDGICPDCGPKVKVRYTQSDVWDKIPVRFDIANTWSELEELKRIALQ